MSRGGLLTVDAELLLFPHHGISNDSIHGLFIMRNLVYLYSFITPSYSRHFISFFKDIDNLYYLYNKFVTIYNSCYIILLTFK